MAHGDKMLDLGPHSARFEVDLADISTEADLLALSANYPANKRAKMLSTSMLTFGGAGDVEIKDNGTSSAVWRQPLQGAATIQFEDIAQTIKTNERSALRVVSSTAISCGGYIDVVFEDYK